MSSANRTHRQTLGILNQMLHHAADTSNIAAETSRRRAREAARDREDERDEDMKRLAGENAFLKEELARRDEELLEQKDLVAFWANGNEAYRRTVDHLKTFWAPVAPASPEDVRYQEDPRELALKKLDEVVTDPSWPEERTRRNEARIQKRKQRQRHG